MVEHEGIEDTLSGHKHNYSIRGMVVLVEDYVRIRFRERRVPSQRDYSPLVDEFEREFPLDTAESSNVAFVGAYVQLDVYGKEPHAVFVLGRIELPEEEDKGWIREVSKEIRKYPDDA